jgi:hypothetical protein
LAGVGRVFPLLAGAASGTLVRSVEDPRLFYPFGAWPSMETIATIRAHPGATAFIANLIPLCETAELVTCWVEATAVQPPVY